MNVKQHFSTRLKKLREEKGLNQGQLANELKISRGSVSFYENGERTPDIEIFDRICDFFNVSYDYMLGKSDLKKQDITLTAIKGYTGLSEKAICILKTISTPDSTKKHQEYISKGALRYFSLFDKHRINVINKIIEDKEFPQVVLSVLCSTEAKSISNSALNIFKNRFTPDMLSYASEQDKIQFANLNDNALNLNMQSETSYNASRYILNKTFEKLIDNVIDELEVEYNGNNTEEK